VPLGPRFVFNAVRGDVDRCGDDLKRFWRLIGSSGILFQRPAEAGQIGTGRQFNANFVAVAILVIVLGQFLAQFGCGHPYGRVRIIVIIRLTAEDLNSDGPLLRRSLTVLAERGVDDVAQKDGKTFALVEERVS